jgi:uncharacterized protein (DUF305 family)
MSHYILVGILALALGFTGGYSFAQNIRDSAMNPVDHSMDSAMEDMTADLKGKTGAEFENAFIDSMIVHHEGAVAMAEMVLQKSKRPELVQLAHEIIAAQTREIEMMREWKTQW